MTNKHQQDRRYLDALVEAAAKRARDSGGNTTILVRVGADRIIASPYAFDEELKAEAARRTAA